MRRIQLKLEERLLELSALAMAVIMVLVSLDAGFRYALNTPIYGVAEVVGRYLMVAAIFLALPRSMSAGMQIRIEVLGPVLGRRLRNALEILFAAMALVLFGLVAWIAAARAYRSFADGEVIASRINWLVWPSSALVALGCALLCLRLLTSLFDPARLDVEEHGAAGGASPESPAIPD